MKPSCNIENLSERYEQLVEKEDQLSEEIETCEAYLDGILRFTHKHGDRYHMNMVEDILNALFTVESDRRKHLMTVRFEKTLLSYRMQKQV